MGYYVLMSPTYAYKCDHCNVNIDIDKPMRDSSNKERCPGCSRELRRIFGCNFKLGDSLYDSSKHIADGLAGKPYKGHYFKEDEDSNMG